MSSVGDVYKRQVLCYNTHTDNYHIPVIPDVFQDILVVRNIDWNMPFETSSHEVFSFLPCEEDEVHVLKKDVLELYPVVFQLIPVSYTHLDVYKRQGY